ncbi:hypothetical protein F1L64_07905 [Campylobacter coli]|nr:hypothetical protein [Campylobacter coli]
MKVIQKLDNRHNHYTFKERPKPLSKSKIPIEKIKTYYEEFQNVIRPNKGNYLKSITDVYNLKPEQVRHLLKKIWRTLWKKLMLF